MGWRISIAILVGACGSRSGLPIPEPTDTTTDAGTSANPICAGVAPGEIVTLLSAEIQPASIGVSAEQLIVAEWPFTGDVFRMPRTGGGAGSVVADDEPAVNHLVADAKAAYWVVQGLGGTDGALRTLSSSSSKASTGVGALTRPQGVALFGDSVYFTDGVGPPNDSVNGRIQRLVRGQKSASILASGLGDPWDISVDPSGVYFTAGATLFSLPHAGGVPTPLATTSGLLQHLATDGQRLFWSDTAGSVYRRDHATGTVVQVATGLGQVEGIAADAAGAYLVQRSAPSDVATGGVFAIHDNGVELLASTSQAPLGIAIETSAIYFVAIQGAMGSVNLLCRSE